MKFLLFICINIGLNSCLTTLHPFVGNDPDECLSVKTSLLGKWQLDSLELTVERFLSSSLRVKDARVDQALAYSPHKSAIQKMDSLYFTRLYMASYRRNGSIYAYQCALTEIGGQLFIELLPHNVSNPDFDNHPDRYNFQNAHVLARLTTGMNSMQLEFLDGALIRKQIQMGNMKIKHEYEPLFENFLITAGTQDLRAFLRKYGKDGRLFKRGNMISLTRNNLSL
jgi:hypothetical protein